MGAIGRLYPPLFRFCQLFVGSKAIFGHTSYKKLAKNCGGRATQPSAPPTPA